METKAKINHQIQPWGKQMLAEVLLSNLIIIKMEQKFVFVYAKDGKIKALNIEESKRLQEELVKDGWVHTQTLDAYVYIQYLHNDCEEVDLIDEMKSLTKRPS
jgi:uncharacterized protein YjhX (UPF0386 family)